MADKYLIVGLGNPGRDYAATRHNVGFWVVDELARRHNLTSSKTERKAITLDGIIKGKRVILAKPQTYMNLSGEAVRALVDYYKIDPDKIIVAYDDLDIDLGILRLRKTGGHGGQNGVRNIILHLGTRDFARVRFGIGRPPGRMKARDYVLQQFYGDDKILAQQVLERAADAVELWLDAGIDVAMSQYNGDVQEQAKPDDKPSPEDELHIAERAHELAPRDPKPLQKLTGLYKQLKRLDEAVRAHLKLAEIYREGDKMKSAVIEWEKAVSIRPELLEVHIEIANAYENQLDNGKRAAGRWLRLAEYHIEADELDEARQALAEALRINPQHPKAQELQAKTGLSTPNPNT